MRNLHLAQSPPQFLNHPFFAVSGQLSPSIPLLAVGSFIAGSELCSIRSAVTGP
jgi:hypothetical protein